jgi:hypothetical protein
LLLPAYSKVAVGDLIASQPDLLREQIRQVCGRMY